MQRNRRDWMQWAIVLALTAITGTSRAQVDVQTKSAKVARAPGVHLDYVQPIRFRMTLVAVAKSTRPLTAPKEIFWGAMHENENICDLKEQVSVIGRKAPIPLERGISPDEPGAAYWHGIVTANDLADPSEIRVRKVVEGTYYQPKLVEGPPAETVLSPPSGLLQRYTESMPRSDYLAPGFPEFLQTSGLQRREGEGNFDFAKRVYDWMQGHIQYDASLPYPKSALETIQNGRAECGRQTELVTAILRANGIPTKGYFGVVALNPPGKPAETATHVWADFWEPGIGWVPIDTAGICFGTHSYRRIPFQPGDYILFTFADSKLVPGRSVFTGMYDSPYILSADRRELNLTFTMERDLRYLDTLPESEMFTDFEPGDYKDWTLTGDCWGKEPATSQTFPDQIGGFQGQRFVCTLSPTRGTVVTGKAVSRDFIIRRPAIDFLIGGGKFPGQTCLNLVVDGEIVASATGNDSAELTAKSFDVAPYAGRTAHLEIVDTSRSAQRGYIMVDQISLRGKPLPMRGPNLLEGKTWVSQTTSDAVMDFKPRGDAFQATVTQTGIGRGDAHFHMVLDRIAQEAEYELEFEMRSDAPRKVGVMAQYDSAPNDDVGMGIREFNATPEWQRFRLRFRTANLEKGPFRAPNFFVGDTLGSVWIKNVSLRQLDVAPEAGK